LKVGIPRALHFYFYEKLWTNFFKNLDIETVVSPLSNKEIVRKGIAYSIDEGCYSSKIFIGHVEYLLDKCDLIFVPRIENFGPKEEYCTRLFGIYDLVKNTFPTAKLLNANVNYSLRKKELDAFIEIGATLGKNPEETMRAYNDALQKFNEEKLRAIKNQEELLQNDNVKVLIVSHAYNTYDLAIGDSVVKFFKENNIDVIFADLIDSKTAKAKAKTAYNRMYWKVNTELLGGLETYKESVDGIVLITTFPCGPDSLINELIIRTTKDKPVLSLMIDEQDANAGLMTRLESFTDIITANKRRGE